MNLLSYLVSQGRRIFRPRATTSAGLSISHKSTLAVISSRNRFIVGKPRGIGLDSDFFEGVCFFIYTSFCLQITEKTV